MKIIALTDDQKKRASLFENIPTQVELLWVDSVHGIKEHKNVSAYFDVSDSASFCLGTVNDFPPVPLFVSAISQTLGDFPGLDQLVRINLWPGFMQNSVAELSGRETIREKASEVLRALGWKPHWVADTPGLVAPRILSMVINEAYFTLGEGVSSKDEINTAMKLGTNYPMGPFEWADKIGIRHIYKLLEKLHTTDDRYQIAPALKSEMN